MAQSPLTDEFNGWVREKLEAWKVPGMSLAIVDGDDIFTQGYGYATLPDVEATPDSLYYGASTTKAMVAATLSHMIDSKKYPQLAAGWDTKFSSLIRDDFVLQDEWATNHLTLEDAVCHRTGMPRYDKSLAHRVDGREATCRDVVRNFRNLSLNAEPRTTFQYCNIMYIAMGHAIEAVSGKTLGDMMKEVIWGPLGMKSTYLSLDDVEKAPEHFSAGYYWDKKAEQFKEVPPMEIGEDAAPGGVISTVADYARWVKCLLDEAAPFSSNAHKDMRKPRILATTEPAKGADLSTYGLGWFRNVYKGHVMYSHSGGMHAFGAQVYWFPGAKFGAIALGNTAWTSNAVEDTVLFRLIDEKLGIPESDRFDFEKRHVAHFPQSTKSTELLTSVQLERCNPDLERRCGGSGQKRLSRRFRAPSSAHVHNLRAGWEIL